MPTNVDAVLTGEMSGVSIQPVSFTTQQLASRYVITMTARVELRDVRENKVLWENPSLVFRQEYEAQSGQTAARSGRLLRPGCECARSHDHRIRPHDRQRDPGGVLIGASHEGQCRCHVATPAAVRKQIGSGTVAPLYLLQGEDDVEKSALGHEFEALVEEGLRAVQRRADPRRRRDHRRQACVAVVSSLVAAARTLPMMSPRRVVIVLQAEALLVPKRESEAATRALDELETLFKEPEPQTTLVLVAAPARQAQPDVQAAGEARDAGRVRRDRRSGRRRALDSQPGGGRGRADRSGRRAAARGARRHRHQAAPERRRAAAAVHARPEDDQRSTMCGRLSGRRRCRTTGR